jgi:hypothetical protein
MTRVEELQAKARAGSMTPAEKLEMSNLAAGNNPPATGVTAVGANPAILTMTPEQMAASEQKKAQETIANVNGKQPLKGLETPTAPAMTVDKNKIKEDWDTGAKSSIASDIKDKGKVDQKVATDLESLAANKYVGLNKPEDINDPELAKLYDAQHNSATIPGTSNVEKLPVFPGTEGSAPEVKKTDSSIKPPDKKAANLSFTPTTVAPMNQKAEQTENIPDVVTDKDKKSGFGDKLKELGMKYGIPLLEILQAVGYQRGGINKPTILEQKFENALAQKQQEYVQNLETKRQEIEAARQDKATQQQQDFTANQNDLNRIADKQALGAELSMREKLALMTASQKPDEKPKESVSLKKTF